MTNRALRRVFRAVEPQACPRVVALSRREQDRELVPVPPRSFALPHWRELKSFCTACASMLRNRPQVLVPLVFRRACCCFNLILFELEDIFAKSHASLRAHLSCCKVSSCFLSSTFWSTRIALLRFTFLRNSLRWNPFFPEFLRGATCPWGI